MTFYEHGMFGVTIALTAGLLRSRGWQIVALSGIAAASPDWDGLTILLGAGLYAEGHRVWGHNVLVAACTGAAIAAAEYHLNLLDRAGGLLGRHVQGWPALTMRQKEFSPFVLSLWVFTGIIAALSHLPIDVVYSAHAQMPTWPLQLWWPFSTRGWAVPLVPWGEPGTSVIFVLEMFALYRWPRRSQTIALMTLLVLAVYVSFWWLLS